MSEYSVWPYFVEMGFLLLLAASPLFRMADAPPNPRGGRVCTLDGLRGFLALGVFVSSCTHLPRIFIGRPLASAGIAILYTDGPRRRRYVFYDHWLSVLVANNRK